MVEVLCCQHDDAYHRAVARSFNLVLPKRSSEADSSVMHANRARPVFARSLLAIGLATLIVIGLLLQLDWDGWQPIGWAVILGGGYLSLTHPGGLEKQRAWLVAAPSAGFLLGYTVLYLTKPYWVAIDVASIAALLSYAALEWRSEPK
jgi:hypothetical protein